MSAILYPPPIQNISKINLQALAQEREGALAWLNARASSTRAVSASTLSQYRIEAERVCWYARAIAKPLATWQREDALAYLLFLQNPPTWAINTCRLDRDIPAWTPLRGPLSTRSIRQSSVIASNLCGWMQRNGYLRINPFLDEHAIVISIDNGVLTKQAIPLSDDAVMLNMQDLTLLAEAARARIALDRESRLRQARDHFLAELLTHTSLRTHEFMLARMGDVALHTVPAIQRSANSALPVSVWLLSVGMGRAQRWLPCDAWMATLRAYRTAFGLTPLPLPGETTPLLLSIRKRAPRRADGTTIDSPALRRDFGEHRGITSRSQLLQMIKTILTEAAKHARSLGHNDAAERLAHASMRNLRSAHLRRGLTTGESASGIAHALGLTALPNATVRACQTDLATSIADAAHKLAKLSP